ncbi:hypothetical protein [uncultured Intestinibacter sp.]|nr:hypothetical protein [uncultured Intestinibacter sp.]
MLTKELDNAQISNLLYTHDVLIDIIFEYSRSTGKEMLKHINLTHFTEIP